MSPRPCIRRRVRAKPNSSYFKPSGIPTRDLEKANLSMDEFEALRLIDYENLSQDEACKKMEVSQPTLSRILTPARKKLADAIINAKAINIRM